MVKREVSSPDSDSDGEPRTPLAASTQMTPPKKRNIKPPSSDSSSDDDDESGSSPKPDDIGASESQTSLVSKALKTSKDKYLAKFPFVRPSKDKYPVDIDLTDSGDEVWMVKCPSSVDARKVLLGAKFESFTVGSVSKIIAPKELAGPQLEGVLSKNSTKKPVTIMAGTDFKSFVPVGTLQIREALEDVVPTMPVKSELSVEEEIPFPENIRERHPLLGADYQLAQRLPKHVKKALSLAQQRSDAFYLQKEEMATVASSESIGKVKSKKRKRDDVMDYVDSADDAIKLMIKEEAHSPSPRKKKVKKESPSSAAAVDEDLSWLNEM